MRVRNPLERVGEFRFGDVEEEPKYVALPRYPRRSIRQYTTPAKKRRPRRKRRLKWDAKPQWCYRICVRRDRHGRWRSLRRKRQRNPPAESNWSNAMPWLIGGAVLLAILTNRPPKPETITLPAQIEAMP